MAYRSEHDDDKTLVMTRGAAAAEKPPFTPVTAGRNGSLAGELYVAQQSSLISLTPGLNPLLEAAAPLIMEMVKLRGGPRGDLEELRARLESAVRAFEVQALSSALERSQVMAGRYLLCTALDECVGTSEEGQNGGWSKHALLTTFHNETWGGEKFFQVLERCMQQPAQSLYLLELMYILVSLGFEGRYQVMDRGVIALEALRDKAWRQIRLLRGDPVTDLSPQLEKPPREARIHRHPSLWLVALVAGLGLAVSFGAFSFALNQRADQVLGAYASAAVENRVGVADAAALE